MYFFRFHYYSKSNFAKDVLNSKKKMSMIQFFLITVVKKSDVRSLRSHLLFVVGETQAAKVAREQ